MCFAWNKKIKSEGSKIKLKDKAYEKLANESSDETPASKGLIIHTQVGVGGKLPDAGKDSHDS
jgi:hypothetical protein